MASIHSNRTVINTEGDTRSRCFWSNHAVCWKTMGDWDRKVVRLFKWDLVEHTSRNMKDSDLNCNMNCGD